MENTRFLDLYSDVNVTFYVFICFHFVALNEALNFTFWYFITCYKYSIRNFQKIFHQTVMKHVKIIVLSVAFFYSLKLHTL